MNKNGIPNWSMGFIFIGGGERQQTKRVQRLRAGGRVVGAGWPNHLWAGWHGLHRVGWEVGVAVKAKEIVKHLIRPSATLLKFIQRQKVSGSHPSDLQDQKLWWWDQPFLFYTLWGSLWLTFVREAQLKSAAFKIISWGSPKFLWTLSSTQQSILNHQAPSQSKTLQQLPLHLNKSQTPYGGTAAAPCLPLCFHPCVSPPCIHPSSHTAPLYSWNTGRLFPPQGPSVSSAWNSPLHAPSPPNLYAAPSCNSGLSINVTSPVTFLPLSISIWPSFYCLQSSYHNLK